MQKFRKKPVVIEAIQFDGFEETFNKICEWIGAKHSSNGDHKNIIIKTLEGDMRADRNDWIIQGVNGEFYPCKPDIFEKTYEKVED